MVMNKYRNEKVIKNILSTIATIISSDFTVIDYENRNIDGKKIETIPDIIIEEVLIYTLLV
jgi:D-alanine-D-alanine ligase-like ATP-grasp enzyme